MAVRQRESGFIASSNGACESIDLETHRRGKALQTGVVRLTANGAAIAWGETSVVVATTFARGRGAKPVERTSAVAPVCSPTEGTTRHGSARKL